MNPADLRTAIDMSHTERKFSVKEKYKQKELESAVW